MRACCGKNELNRSPARLKTTQGEKLGNWSNTYINFQVGFVFFLYSNFREEINRAFTNMQMGSEARVEVEVRKLFYLIWHKFSYLRTAQNTSFYNSIISTAQVTKLWGDKNISTAVVHPLAAAEGCEVRERFHLK